MLTKDQILSAPDLDSVEVEVPQWGGTVKLRALKASERADIERQFSGGSKTALEDPGGFRCALLLRTMVNEDGTPLFDAAKDMAALLAKSAAAVEVVFEAACRLNGFSKSDQEELAKN